VMLQTPQALSNKSLFAAFSSEKEVLKICVISLSRNRFRLRGFFSRGGADAQAAV
jgi:hypothetical protein